MWQKMMRNEVLRFIFSSGLGFVVDIAAFYLLFHFLFTKTNYNVFGRPIGNFNLSFTVSFCLGVITNFLADRYLVFTQSTLAPVRQFSRFILVAFVGYFANLGLLNVYIRFVHLDPPIARPAAALSLFVASFFVHKFFSFNVPIHSNAESDHQPGN